MVHTGCKQVTPVPTPGTVTCVFGNLQYRCQHLCSRAAKSGEENISSVPTLPITHHACREGNGPLGDAPPLVLRGGR